MLGQERIHVHNPGHQSNYTLGSKYTKGVFTIEETMVLRNTCAQLQSCYSEDITMCQIFHKYIYILFIKIIPISHVSTRNPCIALGSWNIDLFGPPPSVLPNQQHPTANNRPIEIHFFAKVSFSVGNSPDVSSFVIAHVSWFKPHPDRQPIGKPAKVWCNSLYELFGNHSIEYILCRCSSSKKVINSTSETVRVIVLLIEIRI